MRKISVNATSGRTICAARNPPFLSLRYRRAGLQQSGSQRAGVCFVAARVLPQSEARSEVGTPEVGRSRRRGRPEGVTCFLGGVLDELPDTAWYGHGAGIPPLGGHDRSNSIEAPQA